MSKVVYLGTSEFAATVLARLADSPHRPKLAVTLPDRRAGRGRRLSPPPVATRAAELEIDLIQPESINSEEAFERISSIGPSVVAVCAYGQLIKEPLLSSYLMLNVHPSMLPRWRGAAPIEHAIMAGDAQTGVTIMRLAEGLDSGPIVLQHSVDICGASYGELAAKLSDLSGEMLIEAIDASDSETLDFREQDDSDATYAEKIGPIDRHIDLMATAVELERQVRALSPHIGAYVEDLAESRTKILKAKACDGEFESGKTSVEDGHLYFGTGKGRLEILELQPAGSRAMVTADYLRGHTVPKKFMVLK